MIYYNEIDAYAAAWLTNLGQAGLIPSGWVDPRSIIKVDAAALEGAAQAHFFAGIGGWPLALQIAGWPGDREVWTGSCPCQPFSVAGKGKGKDDERHLWPEWLRLIAERRPATIFGEQVASPLGREWLAGVRVDLEALGYAVGAADLCAAGAGAPHIRQRLYWVAHAPDCDRGSGEREKKAGAGAYAERRGGFAGGGVRRSGVGNTQSERLEGREFPSDCTTGCGEGRGVRPKEGHIAQAGHFGVTSFWREYGLVFCRDDKIRRVEPGTFPLAHGVPGRMGKLRAYGNAIVPQIAAEFIRAFLAAV